MPDRIAAIPASIARRMAACSLQHQKATVAWCGSRVCSLLAAVVAVVWLLPGGNAFAQTEARTDSDPTRPVLFSVRPEYFDVGDGIWRSSKPSRPRYFPQCSTSSRIDQRRLAAADERPRIQCANNSSVVPSFRFSSIHVLTTLANC